MFLLTIYKQLLIIFRFLIIVMGNPLRLTLFGIVFIDARKYSFLYKT